VWSNSGASQPSAAFFGVDGDGYVPSPLAAGPWAETVSGPIIGGLLGRTIERDAGDPDLQPARLTVDMPRPTLLEPVAVQTIVVREGRRTKLVDAVATQRGQVTARASVVFLRRGAQPDGQVWSPPTAMPAPPPESDGPEPDLQMLLWAYGAGPTPGSPRVKWQRTCSPKFVWVRQLRPLVEGEALTPFTNAAMAGDVTSALTHWGTAGLRFVNVDFTVSLSRLPDGPHIGLASAGHHSVAGVASGVATLFDRLGPIGTGVAVALANTTDTFTPRNLAI
jgi:Thioesterase-like superfamily